MFLKFQYPYAEPVVDTGSRFDRLRQFPLQAGVLLLQVDYIIRHRFTSSVLYLPSFQKPLLFN